MGHLGVFTSLIGVTLGFATVHAFQPSWTAACFWTKDFNSSDDSATDLCNHVIYEDVNASYQPSYEYHNIDPNTLTLKAYDFDQDKGYKNVMRFKKRNPQVKVELSVGDWQTPKQLYDIARNETNRENFINSSIELLEQHNFGGLHLVLGSPAPNAKKYFFNSAEAKREKENLTYLLRELYGKLKSANLSFSFGIRGVLEIDCNMEVEEVYANADLVFLYAYNYHGSWEESTGAFAPIYPGPQGSERVNSYYMQRCKKLQMLQIYLCYFWAILTILGHFWANLGNFG